MRDLALGRDGFHRLPVMGLVCMTTWLTAQRVVADEPRVEFDFSYAVECRDVTAEEFAALNPNEKIIEAAYRVSVRVTAGRPADVEEVVLEVDSPEHRLWVVDFCPKTVLASDVAGQVDVSEKFEQTHSLEFSLGGGVAAEYGPAKVQAAPSGGAGQSQRTVAEEKYQRLPRKQLLVAAGTTDREHGVFFKFKPSSQDALEGMKSIVCRYAVPREWRGDWAVITCRARGNVKGRFFSSTADCGYQRSYVGLHLAGDDEAKQSARLLAEAQQHSARPTAQPALARRPDRFSISEWFGEGVAAKETRGPWPAMPPLLKFAAQSERSRQREPDTAPLESPAGADSPIDVAAALAKLAEFSSSK